MGSLRNRPDQDRRHELLPWSLPFDLLDRVFESIRRRSESSITRHPHKDAPTGAKIVILVVNVLLLAKKGL